MGRVKSSEIKNRIENKKVVAHNVAVKEHERLEELNRIASLKIYENNEVSLEEFLEMEDGK